METISIVTTRWMSKICGKKVREKSGVYFHLLLNNHIWHVYIVYYSV